MLVGHVVAVGALVSVALLDVRAHLFDPREDFAALVSHCRCDGVRFQTAWESAVREHLFTEWSEALYLLKAVQILLCGSLLRLFGLLNVLSCVLCLRLATRPVRRQNKP